MEATRHSVGMAVLGALAARLDLADRWQGDKRVSGEVIVSEIKDTPVILLRPKLLMNINGVSVAKAAAKYGVRAEDIVLVHDELDKPLGKTAFKYGGSASGHNGVRSCIYVLQSDVMLRLRVGIGRPEGKRSVQGHVLGRFSRTEEPLVAAVLQQSVDLLLSRLAQPDLQSPVRLARPDLQSPVRLARPDLQSPVRLARPDLQSPVSPPGGGVAARRDKPVEGEEFPKS
ncbi:putative peptidyl-tRNA hydrolase [Merluccius polli]|uniref:peptidyl-tRNA hydrolase n=1 Tax=Merluccius polli TaxID=89951 RepID=A0AA47NCF6_MERPO|nr:putative peptidyl-tRNA hydrolase [Merluccius polli]